MKQGTILPLVPLLASTILAGCGGGSSTAEVPEVPEVPTDPKITPISGENWNLVWNDEFDGTQIDGSKWEHEINCWGGGNGEQQCYTDKADNAYVSDGLLHIVAKREDFTGPNNPDGDWNNTTTLPYTSARLRTMNKGDWQYGRFEIKAKMPSGQGSWPAIWMLPTDYVYGGWAASGEIDIMEAVNLKAPSDADEPLTGTEERRVYGTLHYGGQWPNNVHSGLEYYLPDDLNPADDFHVYAVEWEKDEIRWYVDDVHYATQRSNGWYSQYYSDGQLVTGADDAPFNQKFHLLLNLAMGGSWAGNTNDKGIDDTALPQALEVDYVRVFECSIDPVTGQGCGTSSDGATLVEGHSAP